MPIPNLTDLIEGILRGTIRPGDVYSIVSQMQPDPTPITWDEAEKRKYEYGVSQGVLYPMRDDGTYASGVPWDGLVNITDKPEGGDINKMYADGIFYAGIRGSEEYHADVEAYTYPDEFAECDGSQQPVPGMYLGQQTRRKFGLCWRSEIGNANTQSLGYRLHVAYGLTAAPTEKSHDTVNDSPEANLFNWSMEGTPVSVLGHRPTAKLEFDSTRLSPARMEALEELLYGGSEAGLPKPDDILNILEYAYGKDIIGRQQISGEIDYVKDGVLYRGFNAPEILISDPSELDALAPIYTPGAFAYTSDLTAMWQLDANQQWVRMI